mmetsp:Transcript_31911/g.71553  ORF Transcript_31911/g.71553 Transcript_31911/m.71553 type:complete len:132 (+) Transcript_31911:802-1197(+)
MARLTQFLVLYFTRTSLGMSFFCRYSRCFYSINVPRPKRPEPSAGSASHASSTLETAAPIASEKGALQLDVRSSWAEIKQKLDWSVAEPFDREASTPFFGPTKFYSSPNGAVFEVMSNGLIASVTVCDPSG